MGRETKFSYIGAPELFEQRSCCAACRGRVRACRGKPFEGIPATTGWNYGNPGISPEYLLKEVCGFHDTAAGVSISGAARTHANEDLFHVSGGDVRRGDPWNLNASGAREWSLCKFEGVTTPHPETGQSDKLHVGSSGVSLCVGDGQVFLPTREGRISAQVGTWIRPTARFPRVQGYSDSGRGSGAKWKEGER